MFSEEEWADLMGAAAEVDAPIVNIKVEMVGVSAMIHPPYDIPSVIEPVKRVLWQVCRADEREGEYRFNVQSLGGFGTIIKLERKDQ